MRFSQIRAKLSRNEPVLITTLHLCDATLFEMGSLMGFDGLWIDMEHHAHSLDAVQNLMRAARIGRSDIVLRPAKGEFMRMGRMLEAGAQVIIYPRCDNADEAAEFVTWAKFPPVGKRGCDGGCADNPYCFTPTDQYIRHANEQTVLVAQIEDPAALENVESIAAVPGIDAIFLGPGDFSAFGGFPGQINHPLVEDASRRIAEATRRAGKHWGRPVASAEEAQRYVEQGARFFNCSSDLLMIKEGLLRLQRTFVAAGFSFNPASSRYAPFAEPPIPEPKLGRRKKIDSTPTAFDR
jgi:4-hydroxy-2-oxoheptanedioate aldolase